MNLVEVEALEATLREAEGEVPYVYQDNLGYWTIGVGRLVDVRKGGKLSPEEIAILLRNDVTYRILAVEANLPWIRSLDPVRRGVLFEMSFQLGVEGLLKFSQTLKFLRNHDFLAAADAMMQSLWARQTPVRARRLAEKIRHG